MPAGTFRVMRLGVMPATDYYVAWATMFLVYFDRKSKLTVASSGFCEHMILAAAYMNWIPEIANLQPVLNLRIGYDLPNCQLWPFC
jgi:hypothetical protein